MARPSQRRGSSFQEQLIGRPGNVVSNQSEQRNRLSVLLQEWQDPVGAALVLAQCLRERTHIGQRLYQQFELELFALRYSSSIRPSSAKNSITSLAKRDDTTKTHSQNPCSSSWTDHPEDVLSQAVMQAYTKLSREILLRSSPPDSSNRRNNRIATRNRRQSTTLTSSSHSEDRFSSSLSTTSSCLISPTLPQGSQQKYRMGDFFHAEDEQEQLQFTAVSPSPSSSNTYASKRMDEGLFPPPTTTTTSRTVAKKLPSQPVVIVDDELDNDEFENDMDDEGSGSRTTQDTVTTRKSANQTLALMDFWVHLLEHIQVHAQSRIITPSLLSSSVVALPKRRGRPKQCCPVFSVAPLDNSGSVFPHHDATIMTLPQLMALRLQLQRQLRAPGGVFHPVDNNTVQQHQQNRKFLSTTREGCGEQPDDAPLLCSAIQRRNNNKMNSTTAMLLGQARVYVVQCIADDCIWIKINSGHCSYSSLLGKENSSSRKTINYKTGHSQQQLEFAAVISPECPQGLAFAVCKNNRPVKAPMTKAISAWKESILVTLKNALGSFFSSCPDDNNSSIDTDIHSLKLGSESCQAYFGTDPRKLLRLVQRDSLARTVPAVGRFVGYAKAAGNSSRGDPVAALCKALTGSLHGREQEKRRLSSGARHGRLLASDFSKDDGEMTSGHQEQIVALTDTATSGTPSTQAMTNIACDTHATTVHLRKRRGDEAFGCEVSQGAVFTRVRWDWTGDAAVALASLLPTSTIETSEGESTFNGRGTAGSTVSSAFSPNQPRKVKCRVTMSGSDVLAGMRELVEAGFMKGPLPPYIQDAALYLRQNDGDCEKSGDGLIYVDHGAVLG